MLLQRGMGGKVFEFCRRFGTFDRLLFVHGCTGTGLADGQAGRKVIVPHVDGKGNDDGEAGNIISSKQGETEQIKAEQGKINTADNMCDNEPI